MTAGPADESILAPKAPKRRRWLRPLLALTVVIIVIIGLAAFLNQPGQAVSCSSETTVQSSPGMTVLYPSGNTHDVPVGSGLPLGVKVSSAVTISGGYSANSSVEFFIMTDTQYTDWQSRGVGAFLFFSKTVLNFSAGHYFYRIVATPKSGFLSGSLSTSVPMSFYLMTPAQFATFNSSTPQLTSAYSVGPSEDLSISGNIAAGTYYAVFMATDRTAATIEVTHAIRVIFSLSSSDYLCLDSKSSDNFSLSLGAGTYALVWVNLAGSDIHVVVTRSIGVTLS